MPKEEKKNKKIVKLRHVPLGTEARENFVKPIKHKNKNSMDNDNEDYDEAYEEEKLPESLSRQIIEQAREQRIEMNENKTKSSSIIETTKRNMQMEDDESDYDVILLIYYTYTELIDFSYDRTM
jgi:uncharacterized protein with WD repeat